jgi:hypothetical protein
MRPIPLVLFLIGLLSAGFEPAQAASDAQAAPFQGVQFPFYVYKGFRAPENHYVASGWMGDYGDIRLDEKFKENPKESKTVIKLTYSAKSAQSQGWAGIYWQNPANNWGSKAGGFNLNGARKVVFKARGDKGGETVAQFKVGGISGNFADSGSAAVGPVTLSKEWKHYEIPLEGQELSSISGGFCWTMSRDENPEGAVFYLDDVRFE